MQNNHTIHEPQAVLEVREWKRHVSAEIEQLGYPAFREKCREEFKDFWAEIETARKAKS